MATLPPVRNNVTTTLRSAHASGDGMLRVQPGAGNSFGNTFPIRVTCVHAADRAVVIFWVTARTADDLTTSGAIENTTDVNLAAGDLCEMRLTAGAITEMRPGGDDKQVLFNDGGSFGADPGLAYDKALKSLAEGSGTVASGSSSHAEGEGSYAFGDASHAEGQLGNAYGHWCHVEGWITSAGMVPLDCTISGSTVTIAGDHTSTFTAMNTNDCLLVSLGGGTDGKTYAIATVASRIFGGGNTVLTLTTPATDATSGKVTSRNFATHSHAEGFGTAASGGESHAEGNGTTASGQGSHAEGTGTEASGDSAHAEGGATTASGQSSHAQGEGSVASASISHAEGAGGLATVAFQHACSDGGYSVGDTAQIIPGMGQYSTVCLSCQTIPALPDSPFTLSPGGGLLPLGGIGEPTNRLVVRPNCTYAFAAHVAGRKTDGTKHAYFIRQGMISNEAGTTVLVGAAVTIGTDFNAPGWSVAISADDVRDALQIDVTGEADVRWFARVDLVEISS